MKLSEILIKENLLEHKGYELHPRITTDEISGIAFLAAKKLLQSNKNIAIIAQNLYSAEQIRDLVIDMVGSENVIYIPSEELIESEYLAASLDIKCDRIASLAKLFSSSGKIIVLNVASAIRYYPSPEVFKENILDLKINDNINLDFLKNFLFKTGYNLEKKVEKSGDFAIRGDIVDVFPFNYVNPIRIEFFDTQIESIKYFKIESQQSYETIERISIIPATEFLLSKEEQKNIHNKFINAINNDVENGLISETSKIMSDLDLLESNTINNRLMKYFSFLQDRKYSIFDYFKCEYMVFSNYDQCNVELNKLNEEATEFLYKSMKKNEVLSGISLFFENFKYSLCTKHDIFNGLFADAIAINIKQPYIGSSSFLASLNAILNYKKLNYKIYVFFDNEQQINFYKTSLLLEKTLNINDFNDVELINHHLSNGIDFVDKKVIFLSSKEIFGMNYSKSKYESKFKNSTIIKSYDELSVGDYVVHEKYGVALYNGIKKMTVNNIENDYMYLKYDGNDYLYVPLEQFKYIRKYIGRDGFVPKLSKLYSVKWENTKKKVKEKINFLADKLSVLYKNRELINGFQFDKDDVFQLEFDAKFPYKLTIDQEKAILDVKNDMESPRPMDRLICGDVGFGKTEIAFRAAFKCINNGKQVLLLCPTTLLAKQHYQRALERFSGFDVKIECLTRFLTQKEFEQNLSDIKSGRTHFIIGTHKALSNKIDFKDLGLLIIDEEQRFGVEHKEIIQMNKNNIDVLTLSATPIPRTLQLSLVGMKSISIINTAPNDRNPIQTYLIEYNENVIFELIARELGRNGQVYYVRNNISTLFDLKRKIESNIPNVRVEYVNGKMNKEDIDLVMNEFYAGKIQILITTTIIENGIDVARANLIIIENADTFGLAQLYQLKGRVGRSNRLAYAYLTYDPNKRMDEVAKKRLKSIQEFTELGSGYKIAQRDLMIRGAGDILGSEQAGFIDDIGIDLYLKLLNEAIKEKEGGNRNNTDIEYKKISASGYIPDLYADESDKFEIYKWVDDSKTIDELSDVVLKIKDIYGRIPKEFNNVIKLRKVKIVLLNEEFMDFVEDKNNFSIFLSELFNKYDSIGSKLFSILLQFNKDVFITTSKRNLKIVIKKKEGYLDLLYSVLLKIDKLYIESKNNEIR